MTKPLGAVLVAEVGSLITKVTLVDQVERDFRLISHAETASTVELPFNNALVGILEAAAQISDFTGRQLLTPEGQLLMPQTNEQDGVNQIVVTTSATGTLSLVIAAIASDVSARSALHASRSIYSALLQVVTLDDAVGQPLVGPAERSWIERQVERLLSLQPDLVLIAGGLDGGAVGAVKRLAHIVGLTAVSTGVTTSGEQQQELKTRPVIYAGNQAAREQVSAALQERAELVVVDNVRPTLTQANLDPTRQALAELYERLNLPRLAGVGNLRSLSRAPLRTVCQVQGMMTRFLAERTGRRVLLVDAGASASAAFYAAPGRYHPALLGTIGTAYGISSLLADVGLAAIKRWLPFTLEDNELTERLLNSMLRPQMLPADTEAVYLSQALACEALRVTYAALNDETAVGDFDWLIAAGGVLAHSPAPGLALLTLLNALNPTGESDNPVVDVFLDTLGLLVAGGALAGLDEEAAISMLDRDLLQSTALASVVTLLGEGKPGELAAQVELSAVKGRVQQVAVAHGELVRIPLPQGYYGQLRITPAAGVRVGTAAPGEVLASPGADLAGSELGLVIDARGRPLRLPEAPAERCALLWRWLVALGVEQGENPYVVAEPAPQPVPAVAAPTPVAPPTTASPAAADPPAPATPPAAAPPPPPAPPAPPAPVVEAVGASEVVSEQPKGKRISLDDLKTQEQVPASPPAQPGLESDLDSLRQTVEETPKRRGWFGRKK
ncbi:glutamate mutase L [Candidatus Viridilinea mediisalina]|uniref:Methylaspartate mutase n=1 Tax=Candidatus Viridilinea mediisalina TaxID=2024553 RepID=A0A2A6RLS4_9CHLR|nr:glutamate mutase L [Candidatus Viridilinea mediisalina]PDW03856.1 hypothetical protein CJ255_06795 [Candidatus Viridilinea mediisalina]